MGVLEPGWLQQEFDRVREDLAWWPEWMVEAATREYGPISGAGEKFKKAKALYLEWERQQQEAAAPPEAAP